MKPGRELDALVAKAMGYIEVPFETAKRNPPEIKKLPATEPIWVFTIDHECKINPKPWVYRRHFGAGDFYLWSPSTDIAAAWQVVEKLAEMGYVVSVCWGPGRDGRRYASVQMQLDIALAADLAFRNPRDMDAVAETVPLAICLAALEAAGVEVGDGE